MNTVDLRAAPPAWWPLATALGALLLFLGLALALHDETLRQAGVAAAVLQAAAALCLLYGLFGWFLDASRTGGRWPLVKRALTCLMLAELFFFAALFAALFYVRHVATPWLAGEGAQGLSAQLWPQFERAWPQLATPGDRYRRATGSIGALGIPLANTLLLFASSITASWAYAANVAGRPGRRSAALAVTALLGAAFLALQGYEYLFAYHVLELRPGSGIYGSLFYFLTGAHGIHVVVGLALLGLVALRLWTRQRADDHLLFGAAVWYWHFVDTLWLLIYLLLYCL